MNEMNLTGTIKFKTFELGKIEIENNFTLEEIKNQLEKYYLSYGKENIKQAKDDRADLNNKIKKINDSRIELEKLFNKPFEEFKSQIKDITNLMKNASDHIDAQVKEIEKIEDDKKLENIKNLWRTFEFNFITFDRIYDEKYLNKTMSMKKIEEDMIFKINKISADLNVILRLTLRLTNDKEKVSSIQAEYLKHLDINKAIDDFNEREKLLNVINNVVKKEEIIEHVDIVEQEEDARKFSLSFKISATDQQIKLLSKFLKENDFEYERL